MFHNINKFKIKNKGEEMSEATKMAQSAIERAELAQSSVKKVK